MTGGIDSPNAGAVILRALLAGVALGAAAAIVFTVDSTVRQPNFEPASFLVSVAWLFPALLVGGVALGASIGLLSGVVAVSTRRVPARRVLFALSFILLSGVAVAVSTPEGQWVAGFIARLIVLAIACLVAAIVAARLFATGKPSTAVKRRMPS